jgi:carbamoyl-phosphate synthase small subunit
VKGYLVLKDGSLYEGELFGAHFSRVGEVVFNTSMTGYQEVLTDPSYFGQIVVMTYPLIGNYGVHPDDAQSEAPMVRGMIVREKIDDYSHWRGNESLDAYMTRHGIIGIAGIDTRALTRKIRSNGTIPGMIIENLDDLDRVTSELEAYDIKGYVNEVTTKHPYVLTPKQPPLYRAAVLDFGIKRGILRALLERGVELHVFPAHTSADEVLACDPDGILLSNGPGDPSELLDIVEVVKTLIGKKPIFGICLGHQLLTHAFGGKTEKLIYGHRGGNHPVKDLIHNHIVITAQNHGYVTVQESLDLTQLEITHLNVNDGSIEGMRHRSLPIFSVQYHPEASPGPRDSDLLFDQFVTLMEVAKHEKA